MAYISDAEVSILLNAFTKIKAALREDKSSVGQNILKGIIESEKIANRKMRKEAAPLGGSVVAYKIKSLFDMFQLTQQFEMERET